MMETVLKAAEYIRSKIPERPKVGLILGSGLGDYADTLKGKISLPYSDIPGFPVSTVAGHAGEWIGGKVDGMGVAVMRGRFHFYEGYPMKDVVLPVRVMRALGVETLIITNAAGGINLGFVPGDLMLIADHINLSGQNPLIGPNFDQFGLRFPDMSRVYDGELRDMVKSIAQDLQIQIKEGVYVQLTGPSFETPAEIRMLRGLGADAVGMSTVPEAIAARHSGMRVLGISCITNMAAGILDQPLTHEEVMETGNMVKDRFASILHKVLSNIAQS